MKEFNKALGNFINDAAAGGAVRHLADLGYSITQISEELNYPIAKEKIAAIMWEHFLNIGKISLEEPKETHDKVAFVKEQDEFGRISFRRVTEIIDNTKRRYIVCNYGQKKYQNPKEFDAWLNSLNPDDREYIQLLPWPLGPVYHEVDERIKRINKL